MRLVTRLLLIPLAALGGPLAAQQRSLLISHVSVVDVRAGQVLVDHAVLVRGDRIAGVGPGSAMEAAAPAGTERIDAGGRHLIPGLWDMHVHALWDPIVTTTVLPLMLTQGITGVRDMGGTLAVLDQVRAGLRAGTIRAPRIIAAGPILDGPEPVDPSVSLAISTPAEGRAAVATLARAGVDFIKVYTLLPAPAFRAVMQEAADRGLRVSGHVPAGVTPVEAAAAGMWSIEHMRAELGGYCTRATAAACEPIIAAFRRYGTWQVPTLAVRRARAYLDAPAMVTDARLAYVPVALRTQWISTRRRRLEEKKQVGFAALRAEFEEERWLAGELRRAGVPMLAGSDAGADFSYHGFGLHDELAQLVAAGFTPLAALQAATVRAAKFVGRDDRTGVIVAGADADLVLLDGNPLDDITAVARIHGVMTRGTWLSRADLDRMMEGARRAAAQ